MTPYSGLLFFYLLVILLIPAVLLGLWEKSQKLYGMIFTVIMLIVVFAINGQLPQLIGFYLWEMALCALFWRCKKRTKPLLWLAVGLSVLPLALVKLGEVWEPLSFFGLLGISYMTFRAAGVLMDIYDGTLTKLRPGAFSYFLLFSPRCLRGPLTGTAGSWAIWTGAFPGRNTSSFCAKGCGSSWAGLFPPWCSAA